MDSTTESSDIMSSMEQNRFEWKFKKLVGSIVLNAGGMIFGGYVRDSIIHDYYSKKYYESCKQDAISIEEEQIRYMDPDFYPDTKDRYLNPEDIDCFFKSFTQLKAFEELLNHSKLCHTKIFVRDDASKYLTRLNIPENTISHIRYKISHLHNPKKTMLRLLLKNSFNRLIQSELYETIETFINQLEEKIKNYSEVIVDILILKTNTHIEFSPPFGTLDFECNGLLLTKQGLTIANDIKELNNDPFGFISDITKQTSIIQDIILKKARLIRKIGYTIDPYRIEKMKEKGWELVYGDFLNVVSTKSIDPEDVCIICHESVKETDHYKLKCCSARYHKKCLIDASLTGSAAMSQTNKCVMCKQKLHNMAYDVCILQIKL